MFAHIHKSPVFHRCYKDASARGQNNFIAASGKMYRRKIFDGILDPMFAQVVKIGRKFDGDRSILSGSDVVEPKVGAELINNLALR